MGLRFRKSVKIAPGVKVNLGKKSAGISVGNKYGGVSVNSKTGARARVSAPGTGLSYSKKSGSPPPGILTTASRRSMYRMMRMKRTKFPPRNLCRSSSSGPNETYL